MVDNYKELEGVVPVVNKYKQLEGVVPVISKLKVDKCKP